jgi:hypothetical protein
MSHFHSMILFLMFLLYSRFQVEYLLLFPTLLTLLHLVLLFVCGCHLASHTHNPAHNARNDGKRELVKFYCH